ncbi:IucA/IucC family protein [Streptomyces polyrhachis]|uniref:IucA/IucC family protein n=1 Tax=Streptomyces polyrhachis TaxID=1282885 RepID=A0ABW2G9P2_9ACTN
MPQTAAERTVLAQLLAVRPESADAYTAALPGARAAVLGRLWRGLVYEPLSWVARREGGVLELADGRRLVGPPCDPYAVPGAGSSAGGAPALTLDGVRLRHPGELARALGFAAFARELDGSAASLALSRAAAPPAGAGRPDGGAWAWEQAVVDGHPYHPCCRHRPGFGVAEELAYAPEHRPLVRLALAPVMRTRARVSGEWPAELRDGRRLLIPVHPWQAAHVLTRTALTDGFDAHPLMALRTLAPAHSPRLHVKTALSARLTSSVRDISTGSIDSAAAVSALVADLAARLGGLLHVTRNLGAASAGRPELAAVVREAPEVYADAAAGEYVVPLAALAPQPPDRVAELARLALPVCLRLLGLGVALEAHGQNLLAVLGPDGRPRRLVYRDLADIRVSPARLARHGLTAPVLPARMLTDDPAALRRKLFGSLVAGALGPLAGSREVLRTALAAATAGLEPGADLTALRTRPLPVKALTLMRLDAGGAGGDRWTELPGPFG